MMETRKDRVGSACWYKLTIQHPWKGGRLLAWSTDHEEYENGPGPVPVGVIEDDSDHSVKVVYVNRISFAACPP